MATYRIEESTDKGLSWIRAEDTRDYGRKFPAVTLATELVGERWGIKDHELSDTYARLLAGQEVSQGNESIRVRAVDDA